MAPLPIATARELSLNAARIERAYALMQQWTAGPNAPWPAAAIAIGRRGRMLESRTFGRQGPEADAPLLRPDNVFLIASLTKPITCLGAMLLVERGLMNLSDPVTRYIPDFAAHHKESTLVQHLFTHTSGLPDMLPNNLDLRRAHAPLATFAKHVIFDTVPLFAAGTSFTYQSMGTLIIAELVQRLTGQSIHDFLRTELFEPLQLSSTRLGAAGIDRTRIVRLRTPAEQEPSWNWNSRYWQDLGAPWGGMFSTPAEYAVLCQLLLDQGRHGDRQIVSPATVRMMTTNRLDDLPEVPEPMRRTKAWGLGWQMNHPTGSDSLCDLLGPDAFGHIGATGTTVWCDPRTEAFCVLFTSAPRDDAPWRLVAVSNAVAAALE